LKRIVIAGATGHLGSQIAGFVSGQHENVVLLGRDLDDLRRLGEQLSGPHTTHVIDADAGLAELAPLIRGIAESEGEIDGLISFLGVLNPAPMVNTSTQGWVSSMNVNFLSNVELLRGFSESRFSGETTRRVVMMSSVAAIRGNLGLAPYAAGKAALESFVKSASVELARKRIVVNALRLGLLDFGMGSDIKNKIGSGAFESLANRYPLGVGVGLEVQDAIKFLLNQEPAWMTGAVLTIDGGYSAT
jgi:NAD(P)-dependent dehydrogenase (short-subunit alcohol dehydrogenase family)